MGSSNSIGETLTLELLACWTDMHIVVFEYRFASLMVLVFWVNAKEDDHGLVLKLMLLLCCRMKSDTTQANEGLRSNSDEMRKIKQT